MKATNLSKESIMPMLPKNCVPVVFDGENWIKADAESEEGFNWFDYDARKWANCVTVKESGRKTRREYLNAQAGTVIEMDDILTMLVWIPRYRYRLFNAENDASTSRKQEIEVVFESADTEPSYGGNEPKEDRIYLSGRNGEFLTHPAFRFGDQELSGFWVGKFEPSGHVGIVTDAQGDTGSFRIKPNEITERDQDLEVKNILLRS